MEVHRYSFGFALMIIMILLPKNVMSQGFRLKLYTIDSSSTYDEFDNYINQKGFKKVFIDGFVNNDTTSYYDGSFDSRAIIDYCPKTKIVSSFSYKWRYVSYVTDEFTNLECQESPNCYYMEVFERMTKDYGKPTSILIYKDLYDTKDGRLINDKSIIDTLQISNYINSLECHFAVNWENPERNVSLTCHKSYSQELLLQYKYTNNKNSKLRQEEIESYTFTLKLIETAKWIFIIFVVLLLVYVVFKAVRNRTERKNMKSKERRIEIEKRFELKKKESELNKLRKITEYDRCYGVCNKVITNPNNLNIDFVRVYEKSSVIIINDEKYDFNEIIGYNLSDNSKVIKGEISSSTTTSNASAIGRAVVGAALGGVAGAVIGGATAKQKTEYQQGIDKTIHDYTVNINVNRLSEPLVRLHIGENEDIANEVAALINAIVVRNK